MLYQQRIVSKPPRTVEVPTWGGPPQLSYDEYGQHYECPYGAPTIKISVPKRETLFEFRRKPMRTKRRQWNPFEHYKRSTVLSSDGTDMTFTGLSQVWLSGNTPQSNWSQPYLGRVYGEYGTFPVLESEGGSLLQGLPALYSAEAEGDQLVYRSYVPPDLEDWKAVSLARMLPNIKNELSLVNSLLELKDFASLPRTLMRIKSLSSLFKKKMTKKATLMELLQTGSDGYLQTRFNILPLLSDISGIYKSLRSYASRADALLANEGKPQTKHFRFVWHDPSLGDSTDLSWSGGSLQNPFNIVNFYDDDGGGPQGSVGYRRVTETGDVKFHAQVKYTYVYTAFQRAHARMFTLLDALGVNLDPRIIWNAIPWSFAIDWVLGVNRWLSQLRVGNMDPKIDILRFCWSYSLTRKSDISVLLHNSWEYGTFDFAKQVWNSETPALKIYESVYNRGNDLPSLSSLQASGLNLTELSLATALGITRKRKHKGRRGIKPRRINKTPTHGSVRAVGLVM